MSGFGRSAVLALGVIAFAVGLLLLIPGSPWVLVPATPLPAVLLGIGLLVALGAAAMSPAGPAARSPSMVDLASPPRRPADAPPVDSPTSPPTEPPVPAPSEADSPPVWVDRALPAPVSPRYLPEALRAQRPTTEEITSIPGALAGTRWEETHPEEDEYGFPGSSISASLPFSAAFRFRSLSGGGGARSPSSLQRDMDRLTSQLYELQSHRGPPEVIESLQRDVDRLRSQLTRLETGADNRLSLSRSGASRVSVPEPPVPWETPASRRRACTACGTGLTGGPADPSCDGCGRALCSDCYWRPGPSSARHSCPACAVRREPDPPRLATARASPH